MSPILELGSSERSIRRKTPKALVVVFTLALFGMLAVAQQARSFVTYTTGIGTASEPDRDQALSEATQQAQNRANSTCTGTVTAATTNASNCTSITNPVDGTVTYTCMVTIKDTCSHP